MRAPIQAGSVAVLCWGVLISASLLAQRLPPAEAVATGRIAGHVVSADGAGPIQGVFVRLFSRSSDRTVTTDQLGAYEFADLRPGSYSVTCDRTGYVMVPQNAPPSEPRGSWLSMVAAGAKVEIGAGQVRRDVDVMLARWGVIVVHVTDDLGGPRAGVEVRVLAVKGVGADRLMTRAAVAAINAPNIFLRKVFETDDRGDARIYGLSAGDYVLVADPPRSPLVDADHAGHDRIYPATYYPGTPSLLEAKTLSIGAGDELRVRFSLVQARSAHVSGRVVRWDGARGRGFVILRWNPAGALYPENLITDVLERSDLVDGHFSFRNVHPGDYLVQTSYDKDSPRDGEASIPVTVGADDIPDLVITTAR